MTKERLRELATERFERLTQIGHYPHDPLMRDYRIGQIMRELEAIYGKPQD